MLSRERGSGGDPVMSLEAIAVRVEVDERSEVALRVLLRAPARNFRDSADPGDFLDAGAAPCSSIAAGLSPKRARGRRGAGALMLAGDG